ncbi:hypothetical protein [Natrinema sp. 1APR25-10V2]|uniref:hypothetical protein n=1 Tax=Natrinema sp. 1APR25-10V2 TaxID=2951081 RepID=UPI00287493DE|nr:hypothetical protein [Natrinema sp. 1APR25-10V2]MDS0476298.1 hypothetical protein [Natrinema sp. 1APR25-10V2]
MTARRSTASRATAGEPASGPTSDRPALPGWLERYATYGLYGLGIGTVLCLAALFTNPVPDPSFPWATLPPSLRLPVRQPRIEHWPVTYTIGIWLWVAGFPALFLAGYRRWGSSDRRSAALWLAGLPSLAMLGWTTYCRFLWPKLQPPTWNAPSYTLVCWLYCSSYDPVWSNAAYAVAALGVGATLLAIRRDRLQSATALLGAFGVLAFPLGLPAGYAALRRAARRTD